MLTPQILDALDREASYQHATGPTMTVNIILLRELIAAARKQIQQEQTEQDHEAFTTPFSPLAPVHFR